MSILIIIRSDYKMKGVLSKPFSGTSFIIIKKYKTLHDGNIISDGDTWHETSQPSTYNFSYIVVS